MSSSPWSVVPPTACHDGMLVDPFDVRTVPDAPADNSSPVVLPVPTISWPAVVNLFSSAVRMSVRAPVPLPVPRMTWLEAVNSASIAASSPMS